jgi:predicted ATPase
MDIPGYRVAQEFLRSGPFILFRGRRMADGRPVLLKTPARVPPRAAESDALDREFELLGQLNLTGIPAAVDLVRSRGVACLVMDDRGLQPLSLRLRSGPLELPAFFHVAGQLCEILGQLHTRQIIAGTVSPQTTLASPEGDRDGGEVQLLDLSLASRWTPEGTATGRVAWNATAYVSPEQTGRINRSIDLRSDFYSLGATFYELLAGQPPFSSDDSLELIHSHIARVPTRLSIACVNVPEQLSRVIMRLLAKAAEDRYQSAEGIRRDLEECERAWVRSREIPLFEVAQHDVPARFLIPQRLYGRDLELVALVSAFEATCEGETSLLLVYGYPGIGKTSLIAELSRRILRQRGYFISGKFDQVVRTIPYGALVQAFRNLIWQWLAESEERLATWRVRLSDALGNNAAVLAEVLPEIEFVVGKQPAPAPLDPAEAQNRFRYVFQSFVGTLASADHPLVIFLDDLQWVDPATLDLLSALLTSQDIRHLLVIGAYRDNEVDAGHMLPWAIDRLGSSAAPVRRVSLGPLALHDIVAFLGDTLHAAGENVERLARLILQKTDGNPFFVIQFLKALQQDGLFAFDAARRCWTFQLDRIGAAGYTDNVIDLMTRRIQNLSRTSQSALMVAACIGNPFDWMTFVTASRLTEEKAAAALAEAVEAGLVYSAAAPYDPSDAREGSTRVYAFLHDRVQQAAYELIPDGERPSMHLEVGRLLRASFGADVPDDRIFQIVSHLNIGSSAIESEEERDALARLNLAAGRKAKLSTAYQGASLHLEAGISLLADTDWAANYELMFALHLEAAECHYLAGRFDAAERYFALLLDRASAAIDKAQVHSLRIVLYENLSRFAEAIASGREGLNLFGISFPEIEEDVQEAIEREVEAIERLRAGRQIESLIDVPVMSDPDVRMVMRILTSLWAPSYLSGHQLLTRLISASMVRLSLASGNTEDSAYGYVTHAITVGPVRGDYASAYEWGELALRVNDRFNDSKRRAKVQQQFQAHVKLWRRPFETCIPHAREARRSALEAGDFTYAGYAAVSESWPALVVSRSLDRFVREYSSTFALLDRIRMTDFHAALQVMVNWALALQGRTNDPLSLSDERFDEAAFVRKYEAAAPFFLTFYYTARLHLCVLHGRYREAVEMARRAREVTVVGTVWPILIDFWGSMAISGLWAEIGHEQRRDLLPYLIAAEDTLCVLATNCPENFRCFALLVTAARRRLEDEPGAALNLLDEAVSYARETDNIQMEALASEHSAALAGVLERQTDASAFARNAYRCYVQWGATAKVSLLEATTGPFGETPAASRAGAVPTGGARDVTSLDVATVLKMARAISIEIELDDLLRKLMRMALENAGAERAVFVQDRDDRLTIEASADAGGVAVRLARPCDETRPSVRPPYGSGRRGDERRERRAFLERSLHARNVCAVGAVCAGGLSGTDYRDPLSRKQPDDGCVHTRAVRDDADSGSAGGDLARKCTPVRRHQDRGRASNESRAVAS